MLGVTNGTVHPHQAASASNPGVAASRLVLEWTTICNALIAGCLADYEGRFRGATKLKGIKNFKAKDYGLVPIRLDTWGQFVFILADPSRCFGRL